jgi:hypothetical protein
MTLDIIDIKTDVDAHLFSSVMKEGGMAALCTQLFYSQARESNVKKDLLVDWTICMAQV